ncbi:MAG: tetratricopeptide repeat protein [Deltaproteobacteria bacterium]|nr:tetratricopeptide repeat protein [Deltaproteobacteria bacterium]
MKNQTNLKGKKNFVFNIDAALDQAIKYHISGNIQQAAEVYAEILHHDPDNAYAIHSIGILALQGGNNELALSYIKKAIEINPEDPVFHNNLGLAFRNLGKSENALKHFQRATCLDSNYAEAYHNAGNMLKDLCRPREAVEFQNKAIELRPDYIEAHFNRSVALLLLENFKDGLEEYEWRRHLKALKSLEFAQPLWDGSDLSGKTILLHAEQGLGDTIQFIRYAKVAKESGATVIAAAQDPLTTLLKSCAYVTSVISLKDNFPDFDLQAPLMSLPWILNEKPSSILAEIPYIKADSELVKQWHARLGENNNFKIGLCWQASFLYEKNHQRKTISSKSIPLRDFYPLSKMDGIKLYSLQKGVPTEQLENMPGDFILHDFGPDFDDNHGPFMDSAAVMENLDLVITIDTSIAHLAGALGVPVWVMLPYVPDWRWFLEKNISPWYPTMRLFRQGETRDWNAVIKEVIGALSNIMKTKLGAKQVSPSSGTGKKIQTSVKVEVSIGEFIDKLVILKIKAERITDPLKLGNVRTELEILQSMYEKQISKSVKLDGLIEELWKVNNKLWDTEDALRKEELHKRYDQNFIELARSVYFTNDHRANIKRKINELLGSHIIEEKSYTAY